MLRKSLILTLLCFTLQGCSTKNLQKVINEPEPFVITEGAININQASADELEQLPYVGSKTADEIVAHRKKFGKFRRPEHLILVNGISDKRFRRIRKLIKIE